MNHRLELTRTHNRQGVAAASCLLLLLEKRLPGTRAAGFFLQETSDTPFTRLSIDPLFALCGGHEQAICRQAVATPY